MQGAAEDSVSTVEQTGPAEAAERLEAALERIALASAQERIAQASAQEIALPGGSRAGAESPGALDRAELAARLDGLIVQLRAALGKAA